MHPLWFAHSSLQQFLHPLRQQGLEAVEFEVDPNQRDWSAFEPLMKSCFELGLLLCFHAPYRKPFTLRGFSRGAHLEIQAAYRPLLAIAESWAQADTRRTEVVFHGADGAHEERPELRQDTIDFLTWVLETFPKLTLALENRAPGKADTAKIGESWEELAAVIEEVNEARLGICWDMGHDVLHDRRHLPQRSWLEKVVHVHVHDVDEHGTDHYPLVFDRVPYKQWLPALAGTGFAGCITLELKGSQLAAWDGQRIDRALAQSFNILSECLSINKP